MPQEHPRGGVLGVRADRLQQLVDGLLAAAHLEQVASQVEVEHGRTVGLVAGVLDHGRGGRGGAHAQGDLDGLLQLLAGGAEEGGDFVGDLARGVHHQRAGGGHHADLVVEFQAPVYGDREGDPGLLDHRLDGPFVLDGEGEVVDVDADDLQPLVLVLLVDPLEELQLLDRPGTPGGPEEDHRRLALLEGGQGDLLAGGRLDAEIGHVRPLGEELERRAGLRNGEQHHRGAGHGQQPQERSVRNAPSPADRGLHLAHGTPPETVTPGNPGADDADHAANVTRPPISSS